MGERINLDADTFPKMFPKYDLKKLISQGLDPNLAVMTKMLRQMAQADYKHYSKKRMYGKSYALRAARFYAAYAKQVLEAGDSNVDFKSEGLGFTDYGKQFVELNKRLFEELYNKLGDDLFDLDLAGVKIQPLSQKEGSTWFRRNQETGEMEPYNPAYAFVGPRGQNYYEANELDKALQEGVEQVSKSVDYKKTHPYKLGHYYKPGIKNSDYVGVKLGGKIVPLTEPMTSSEVRKYMSEHNAELQAKAAQLDEQRKLDKKKGGTGEGRWKPELTLGGGRPRVGVDRRGGVDVEPEEFRKAFSFRGVQFGNYVTQRERQRFLNEAYDALMDMAELLGISPRAIAIDGRLGFAIGARGGGKANAHYEPKENVINLTKSKGAGSLAHEWFHALDYYFNRGNKKPTASTANKSTEQFPASTRNEMRKAFLDLMSAIKNSDYFKRSENLEMKLRSGKLDEGYYDKPTELAARAFQDYVVRKLADKGKINDFLSSFTSEEEWNGEPENYPFPIGAEAEKIDEKFDALFDAMQERTDEEGNTILYHLGKEHDVLTDTEIALRDGLVDILRSVGLADEPDEVKGQKELDSAIQANATLQEMRGWHGSAAEFDEFDHSHMSEGEGNQAIGYGTYIASIEEIGRYYGTVAAMQKRFRAAPGYGDYDHYWKGQKIDLSSINPLRMAYDIVQREGTIKKAIAMVEKFVDNPEAHEGWRSALDILRESRKSDFKRKRANYEGERYLYEVDIPENDGTNYLPWDEPLSDAMRERIAQGLRDMGVDLNEPFERRTGKADNFDFLDEQMSEHPITGQELYYKLVDRFGRYPQQASEFLNKYCGLVGIEYPSNFFSGGNKKGLKNHVIFNEKDIKIDNRTQYFISADGVVYGFVKDGKIYIDPKIATAETPIHEYCHLWGDALKEANPEAWERLKETMLGEKDVLDYVKKMYPGLEGDALVGEVFSHYSGRRGAERLRADMEREMKNAEGVFAKARVARVFDIIKRALSRFWTMARDLFAGKTRGLDKLTAEDFADMAMNDLLRGFKPEVENNVGTDVSFHKVTDKSELNKLNKEKTVTRYRAMVEIDGKLYPPMSVYEGGKLRVPTEIGTWERADETPFEFTEEQKAQMKALDDGNNKGDVVIVPGKIRYHKGSPSGKGALQYRLKKDNGSDVWAAYNPYFHTSTSGLNDQFSSAYKRPNLVVAEVEIPESELSSGYKAENAKDAVGDTPWKSGTVNQALPADKQRTVTLSRWAKVKGVVPDAEVAKMIAKQMKGTDLEIPFNTVTPGLRNALIKEGVKIGAPENSNAGKASIPEYERWLNTSEGQANEVGDIVNAEGDIELDKPTLRNWVKNLPTLNKVKRHGDAVSIYDEEDLGNLKGLVSDELYEAVESGLKSPIQRGTCDLDSGFIAIYTGKLKTAFETESTWWHENTHLAFDAIELADKDELGLAALAYVKEHDKSYKNFDRMMRNYRKEQLPGEGACRLIQYIYKNWGAQGIINGDFVGNEKIAKLATAIQNYLFYGETREEETENRLRQSSTNTGGEFAEPRPRIRFDSEQGGEEIQPRGKRGNEEEVEGSRFLKEEGEIDDSGISDEELAGYDAGRYSFAESITQGLVDLALKNASDYQLRMNAMREFGGNLAKLRKIMNKQKAYDKGTVDDIVRLARMVMGSGFFKDMSAYEVKRLLAAIKKGVGAEDLTPIANNVVDMLVQHQLRESKAMLHKLMQVRGRKVDARGVEVQAGLDIDGQRMMSALKDGMSLGENGLLTRINDCENRLGSEDEVIRKNAMSEYQGLMLAKEYHDNILSGEEEEIVLRQEKRQEQEKIYDFRREPVLDDDGNAIINQDGSVRTVERKTLKPQFKNNVTDENKQLRRNTEAAIERIEQSIRESRMERVTSYIDFMSDVAGDVRASRERAAEWRAEQQQRVDEIHHNANSDLLGVDAKTQNREPKQVPLFNPKNSIMRFFFQPLGTFEKFMRYFGRRFHNGEGYLFDRYVRGMIDCGDKEWRMQRALHEQLDKKVTELFGDKKLGKRHFSDLYMLLRDKKYPGIPVEFWDDGERVQQELYQDEALSLVLWSKQIDAEAGLRRMGISEEDIETIKGLLDPKLLEFGDWLVDEFYPSFREQINAVHERMFGAPMAAIEHYFPIVRNKAEVDNEVKDISEQTFQQKLASTIIKSVIKRTRNAAALDVHTSFIDLMLGDIADKSKFVAWSEYYRDLNTLLNYKRFEHKVKNMNSMEFGSGEKLWESFINCCKILTGTYEHSGGTSDELAVNISKGFTTGAIAFRPTTALKQLASLTAFWSDARVDDLLKYQSPWGWYHSWKWAMENLPGFSKRWQSKQIGDTRLMDTDVDWKMWRNNYMKTINRGGMYANAFVDAVTVASGSRAVYETRKRRYLWEGYDEERAERKALQDAANSYKTAQQESEGGYVNEIQVKRTLWAVMRSMFRNASMAYSRRFTTALRVLKDRMHKGYKDDFIEAETKKYKRDGIPDDKARENAERLYRWGGVHAIFDMFNFGWITPYVWTAIAGNMWYLLMGDDDKEKEEILTDGLYRTPFMPIEGLTAGNNVSDIGTNIMRYMFADDKAAALKDLQTQDIFSTPIENEIERFGKDLFSMDGSAVWWDVFSLAIQTNLGFKPETFTDGITAIVDYCDYNPKTTKEFLLLFARVMQAPKSQTDKLFIDELGMTAKDAQKLNAAEMAERYARYKRFREAPLSYVWHTDADEKMFEKYRKQFKKSMKKQAEHLDTDALIDNLSPDDKLRQEVVSDELPKRLNEDNMEKYFNEGDSILRKAIGKQYIKNHGLSRDYEGGEPNWNAGEDARRAHYAYKNQRLYSDLSEDTLLKVAITQAKNRGDNETVKALEDAQKKLKAIKLKLGDGSADDDKAIMEELRARRKEILQEYGIIQ